MITVLANLSRGAAPGCHCRGMSEFGGLQRTLYALRRRGLIAGDSELTDAGRAAFAEWQKGQTGGR